MVIFFPNALTKNSVWAVHGRPAQCVMNCQINVVCIRDLMLFMLSFSQYKSTHLSHDMRFPTMWYMLPARAQTSLRLGAV